ncbi:hypothetical protein [Shinella zoogloeoides]|uniref:DUF4376 domain-containing protein n=1 Tax=Shinella zoogloeoides TaxID=352475 RepID=UPI001F584142|nr:hypothetical protein [Shinella zoogloeoides]
MTTRYSHNGAYPAPLPHTIWLSDGRPRTSQTPFTTEEIADAGYVEAPPEPAHDAVTQRLGWDGENWTVEDLPPPPEPSTSSVDEEHDRRALVGKTFTVTGYGDVALEGSLLTQTVLLALKDTARDLVDAGVTDPVLMLTDRDNVDHYMTPPQVVELVNAGKQYMQELHVAKRALKEMEPVPADFADDGYWPAV